MISRLLVFPFLALVCACEDDAGTATESSAESMGNSDADAGEQGSSEADGQPTLYSACSEHGDCLGSGLICDTRRGCVECLEDGDCRGNEGCDLGACTAPSDNTGPGDESDAADALPSGQDGPGGEDVDADDDSASDGDTAATDDRGSENDASSGGDSAVADASSEDGLAMAGDPSEDASASAEDSSEDDSAMIDDAVDDSEMVDDATGSPIDTTSCEATPCDSGCIIDLAVTYRDFGSDHPDFGAHDNECQRTIEESGESVPGNALTPGIVAPALGPSGTPTAASPSVEQECEPGSDAVSYDNITRLDEWFVDGNDRQRFDGRFALHSDGDGSFANRYGADGEHWVGISNEEYDDQGMFTCSWCLDGSCQDPCSAEVVEYAGNPLFFPLDELDPGPDGAGPARLPPAFGYTGYPWEEDVLGVGLIHNYYFTMELRFGFEYDDALDASITVISDDDTWVFVNGQLAIDMGGMHAAETESAIVGAATAEQFGLEAGGSYEIAVFRAERRMDSSAFTLRLDGFDAVFSSDCSE